MSESRWRERARGALKAYFEKRSLPRLLIGVVILITGVTGFGISAGLLKAGMVQMWMRYPIAVLGAYTVFLLLMRGWAELERRKFNPDDDEFLAELKRNEREDFGPQPTQRPALDPKKGSWWDYLDLSFDLNDSGGCLLALAVAALVGAIVIIFTVIAGAPALIAEVFVDACLAGFLYRRLKIAEQEHWLAAAVKRTGWHVLGVAALLAVIGACLDVMAPGSNSIGPAFREIFLKSS